MPNKTCCFCCGDAGPYGNNPAPAHVGEDDICCDSCNYTIVIPARMKLYMEKKEKKGVAVPQPQPQAEDK